MQREEPGLGVGAAAEHPLKGVGPAGPGGLEDGPGAVRVVGGARLSEVAALGAAPAQVLHGLRPRGPRGPLRSRGLLPLSLLLALGSLLFLPLLVLLLDLDLHLHLHLERIPLHLLVLFAAEERIDVVDLRREQAHLPPVPCQPADRGCVILLLLFSLLLLLLLQKNALKMLMSLPPRSPAGKQGGEGGKGKTDQQIDGRNDRQTIDAGGRTRGVRGRKRQGSKLGMLSERCLMNRLMRVDIVVPLPSSVATHLSIWQQLPGA